MRLNGASQRILDNFLPFAFGAGIVRSELQLPIDFRLTLRRVHRHLHAVTRQQFSNLSVTSSRCRNVHEPKKFMNPLEIGLQDLVEPRQTAQGLEL